MFNTIVVPFDPCPESHRKPAIGMGRCFQTDSKLDIKELTWNPSTWGIEAGIRGHLLYCKFEARLEYLRPSLRQTETTIRIPYQVTVQSPVQVVPFTGSQHLQPCLAFLSFLWPYYAISSHLKNRALPRMKDKVKNFEL